MRYLFLLLFLPVLGYGQLPTRLKLKQLEQGTPGQVIVVDSLGNASYGSGGSDGNGAYSGSGLIPQGTLMEVDSVNSGSAEFAIGHFPDWPDFNASVGETGLYITPWYWGGIGMVHSVGTAYARIENYGAEINMLVRDDGPPNVGFCDFVMAADNVLLRNNPASYRVQMKASGGLTIGYATTEFTFFVNNGTPNGVVTGVVGDIYINKTGGAGTVMWVKESGDGTNTGWIAK